MNPLNLLLIGAYGSALDETCEWDSATECRAGIRAIERARQYDWWCKNLCDEYPKHYSGDLHRCAVRQQCTYASCIAYNWPGICEPVA